MPDGFKEVIGVFKRNEENFISMVFMISSIFIFILVDLCVFRKYSGALWRNGPIFHTFIGDSNALEQYLILQLPFTLVSLFGSSLLTALLFFCVLVAFMLSFYGLMVA